MALTIVSVHKGVDCSPPCWQLGAALQKPRAKVEAVVRESPHLLSKLKFLSSLICGKLAGTIFKFTWIFHFGFWGLGLPLSKPLVYSEKVNKCWFHPNDKCHKQSLRWESCSAVKPVHIPAYQNSREGLVRIVQDMSSTLKLYLPCASCFLRHLAEK